MLVRRAHDSSTKEEDSVSVAFCLLAHNICTKEEDFVSVAL